jgi:hypothetical protein
MPATEAEWDAAEAAILAIVRDARARSLGTPSVELAEALTSLDQPMPTPIPPGVHPTWSLVIEHIGQSASNGYLPRDAANEAIKIAEERHNVGIKRYKTPLHPHNGRDHLKDAIGEVADLTVYLRNEMESLKGHTAELAPYAAKIGIAFQAAVAQFVGLAGLLLEREGRRGQ